MSWRAITEDDVRSAISAAEDRTFRQHQVAEGQTDPLLEIIDQVTLDFREAIRSNSANQLDATDGTLPRGSIRHAVAIIRHRLLTRFNVSEVTEARMAEYREATRYLDAIAEGRRRIEQPDAGETAKAPLPGPAVNPRPAGWRREDQNGI